MVSAEAEAEADRAAQELVAVHLVVQKVYFLTIMALLLLLIQAVVVAVAQHLVAVQALQVVLVVQAMQQLHFGVNYGTTLRIFKR